MGRMDGKVALVTGGASGLGRATATRLAEEGADVAVTDLNRNAGTALADQLSEGQGAALFLSHDVADEGSWAEVMAAAEARFGRLDVLVNNAGVAIGRPLLETTLEEWRAMMAVNLDGVFLGVRSAMAAMIKSGGGSIINISSVAGLLGLDRRSACYCASKGGVRLLTKAAALECARLGYNIRVNSVHPGFIDTPMLGDILDRTSRPEVSRAALVDQQPLKQLGEATDIANMVLFLASEESKYVTGAEMVVDGGYSAQ